ncbi:methyltransferase [Desulfuribacillus stibiiarsenatis]|uniref:Methyltransferase n=1 Tax=Desulfuribacillus stibiiarsenatis TaxID=1390249 RepID=A0A1E5L9C0_9FIRM|nr:methyltransferase domain-containing protein [Desulfuribacillus stibiiarsenatis]OEH86740.1 methyltransferase [Desulfuribacillus stibiiarsenatis]
MNVSEIDKLHLQIIRKNVEDFLFQCASSYDMCDTQLLEIAPQIHEGAKAFFTKTTISTLDIDSSSGADFIADICQDNSAIISAESFDYIVCTEVLEHTLNPFCAVDEIYRILRKNGKAFITVPFNFRIHGPLPDCWRFTEYGLKELFKKFKILALEKIDTTDRDLMPIQYTLIVEKGD